MARKRLNDRKWRNLRGKLEAAEKAYVKVGILASKGGGSKHDADGDATIAEVAAWNEYGTERIPERSFIRSTFAKRDADLERITTKLCRQFVTGKVSLTRALDILGTWGATAIKKTITSGTGVPPPNAASTIARKGSSRPLVDTGRLLGAISHEVVDAGVTGRGGWRK